MNSATHLAAHEGSARRRQALGEFVRTARARITPQMAGLPAGSRRRTPGLRREEVAQLSDISVTWYTWIEQGREVTVSPAVWARIANVLHLARAERAYLFELAECADPQQPRDEGGDAPVSLQACVDAIDAPAYALDRAWNLLASNAAMRELFDDWPLRDAQPNLLRYIFLDPAARGWWSIGTNAPAAWWPNFAPTRGPTSTRPTWSRCSTNSTAPARSSRIGGRATPWSSARAACASSSTRAAGGRTCSRSPSGWPRTRNSSW